MTKRKKYDFSQIAMRKHKTFGKIEERVVSIDILLNGEMIKGNYHSAKITPPWHEGQALRKQICRKTAGQLGHGKP